MSKKAEVQPEEVRLAVAMNKVDQATALFFAAQADVSQQRSRLVRATDELAQARQDFCRVVLKRKR